MATHSFDPAPRTGLRRWLIESFWVADVLVVALFAFFLALGAFSPAEATAVTVALGVLAALYGVHLWWMHRHRAELERDPARRAARERRGF